MTKQVKPRLTQSQQNEVLILHDLMSGMAPDTLMTCLEDYLRDRAGLTGNELEVAADRIRRVAWDRQRMGR